VHTPHFFPRACIKKGVQGRQKKLPSLTHLGIPRKLKPSLTTKIHKQSTTSPHSANAQKANKKISGVIETEAKQC